METSTLSSRGYFLWNNTEGFALGGLESDTQVPVASLTKIMTALITLEQRQLDEQVTITAPMLQGLEEFATISLSAGQVTNVEDLLYATMLPSAGDAAQALAISTSGSISAFADVMNQRAAELGMQNTHFSNPVGLDNDNYSTPHDIAILLQAALQNLAFRTIFTTFEHQLPTLGITVAKTFSSTEYINGGKTGYTNAAGRCLASTAEIEGTEYILVTVGAAAGQNITDSDKIYQFIEDNYQPTLIFPSGTWLVRISAPTSPAKTVDLLTSSDISIALPNDISSEDLSFSYDGVTEISADTPPGDKLGTFTIQQGSTKIYSTDLYYESPPEFYNYQFFIIGLTISGLALLATALAILHNRHNSRSRKRRSVSASADSAAESPEAPRLKSRRKTLKSHRRPPLLCFGIFLLSLLVNFLIFRSWFESGTELEINHPVLSVNTELSSAESDEPEDAKTPSDLDTTEAATTDDTGLLSSNCTTSSGNLMLINPNFIVDQAFIEARRGQLISVSQTYGIPEYHPEGNGDNLMMPEAASHLNDMLAAYRAEFPGHEMGTYSCFRARGTSCGRLCAATGTSDHHTGLTCDLIDQQYGTELNTDHYASHQEWQWLRANSYKYGFVDRFPEAWAGGSMSEPLNVDATGTTGLFETWHYRYVGITAATEIATGKYNNGAYDSLEHYLKSTGRVADLKAATCP